MKKYKFGITSNGECIETLIDEISHYGTIIYVDRGDLPLVHFFLETDEVNFSAILDDYFFPEGSMPSSYEVREH